MGVAATLPELGELTSQLRVLLKLISKEKRPN